VTVVDILIVVLVVAGAVWGYREGLSTGAFALAGFAAGAILGSRVAPLILSDGLEDPFAPVVSLPAALLFGALLAAALERVGWRLRLRVRRRSPVDVIGGALLAAAVAVVAVWILGIAGAQVNSLKDTVRDSSVIEELNARLPPPGPLLNRPKPPVDPLPTLAGPNPNVGPADPSISRDPQVRAVAKSVVKLYVEKCDAKGTGTGWVANEGIVVTNAHVVKEQTGSGVKVQVAGKGPRHDAETIYFDERNDIAVLRVTGIEGTPKLKLHPGPRRGLFVAAIGFPEGGPIRVTPGRLGNTTFVPERDRIVTVLRSAGVRPGSSGSPAVDKSGRVVTTYFAIRSDGRVAYGVPQRYIRRALRRAGPPADTGSC